MRTYSADRIHNVASFPCGRRENNLAEAMLYETGVVTRMGKVDREPPSVITSQKKSITTFRST